MHPFADFIWLSPAYSRIFCLGPNPSYNFKIEGCQKMVAQQEHPTPTSVLWLQMLNYHPCVLSWHGVFTFLIIFTKTEQKIWPKTCDYYNSQDDLKKMVRSNKCLIEFNLMRMQAVFSFRLQKDIYTTYYTLKKTQDFTACIWIVHSYLNSQGQNAPGSPPPCS